MDYFSELLSNSILWISVFSCFAAQFLKIFTGDSGIDIKRIFISGGMPSSHSSFVTCLSTLIGKEYGFNSGIFAVAAVFSCIIMYDASGVRQAVGKQATLLNQLIEDWHNKKVIQHEKMKELIGHTPKEVFLGAMLGIFIGMIF